MTDQVNEAVAWNPASCPPASKPNRWSEPVAALTISGDVFRVSYMHGGQPGQGVWQRLKAMADLGVGGTVVAWTPIPTASEVESLTKSAHPSRGVVDEVAERRALNKALDALDALSERWASEIGLDAMCANLAKAEDVPAAIHAMAVQAWVEGAYAGRTSHQAAALPAVPDGWTPDVSNGGQVSVGDASHTPGRKLWHTDPHGRFWTGYTGTRTAQQLMAECESTIRDLRALLAATPAHDQPEGEG